MKPGAKLLQLNVPKKVLTNYMDSSELCTSQ